MYMYIEQPPRMQSIMGPSPTHPRSLILRPASGLVSSYLLHLVSLNCMCTVSPSAFAARQLSLS